MVAKIATGEIDDDFGKAPKGAKGGRKRGKSYATTTVRDRPCSRSGALEERSPLAPDRGHHCLYPKDVERPSRIVDERREAELGAHVIDASHQEGALIHPLRFWSTKA